jgi:hypothetical protein
MRSLETGGFVPSRVELDAFELAVPGLVCLFCTVLCIPIAAKSSLLAGIYKLALFPLSRNP